MNVDSADFITFSALILSLCLIFLLITLIIKKIAELKHEKKLFLLKQEKLKQELVDTVNAKLRKHDNIKYAWQGYRKFYIKHKELVANNAYSFYLFPSDGKKIPSYSPGQYITVKVADTNNDYVIRCYSISDICHDSDSYRITVKKVIDARTNSFGKCSSILCDTYQVNHELEIKAPMGNFGLAANNKSNIVFIAGGIGITPIYSMIQSLIQSKDKREIVLVYGVLNSKEFAFEQQLIQIEKKHSNFKLIRVFSDALDEDKIDTNYDRLGFVDKTLLDDYGLDNTYQYYVCGPPIMMSNVLSSLKSIHVPDNSIFYESFGPLSVGIKSKENLNLPDNSIAITFRKTNKTINWQPDSGTILDVAEQNGIFLNSGCKAGSCGTCLVKIHKGTVGYISEPDAIIDSDCCLPCMAYPKDVLELEA